MSADGQKRLLNKLLGELESKNVEAYRRSTADTKKHNFIVTRRGIRKGIRHYLQKNYSDRKADFYLKPQEMSEALKAVDKEVRTLIRKTGKEVQRLSSGKDGHYYNLITFTDATVRATFEEKGSSRFDKIYQIYSSDLKEIGRALAVHLSKKFGQDIDNIRGGNIAQLSHKEFEGIIESAVADAIETALAEEEEVSLAAFKSFLKSRGVDLRVIRNSKRNEMTVGLFSTVENQEDNATSKKRLAKLREVLLDALNDLERSEEALSGLPGSDSFQTKIRKEAIKDAVAPFKKIKGVTVKTENIKIKESSGTQKVQKKGKTTLTNYSRGFKKKGVRGSVSPGGAKPEPSMFSLVALINQKLPETVEKNMGPPALTNVTGRFANSVRVTDVIPTAQGFPSIGYTYRKSPYQTFETGNKQGDPERDPRKLINRSIREIAAEMAIGRFYTRRV